MRLIFKGDGRLLRNSAFLAFAAVGRQNVCMRSCPFFFFDGCGCVFAHFGGGGQPARGLLPLAGKKYVF